MKVPLMAYTVDYKVVFILAVAEPDGDVVGKDVDVRHEWDLFIFLFDVGLVDTDSINL